MSRIGKKSVPVPAGVTVNLAGTNVSVKGPKGELKFVLTDRVIAKMVDGGVKVDNIAEIARAGADTFVAGSAIFGKPDYAGVIAEMKAAVAAA